MELGLSEDWGTANEVTLMERCLVEIHSGVSLGGLVDCALIQQDLHRPAWLQHGRICRSCRGEQ